MATYFWVGGAGNWNNSNTTNWSLTSGGLGGLGVPNSTDTALFDANSGTGVVSVEATAVSATTTVNNSGIELNLTGSPTLTPASGNFNFTSGVLTLNTFTLTCGRFLSTNSNTRTINFGTGSISITGQGTTVWNITIATSLTITGTSKVDFTYAGGSGTRTISAPSTGASESNALNYNILAGTDSVTNLRHVKSLDFTGFAGTLRVGTKTFFGDLIISSGMTVEAGTATSTFSATSGTQQITTNGKTIDFPLTFNGIGGTFAFQDALTQGSTKAFTITNGTVQLKHSETSSTGVFATIGANQKFLQSTLAGTQATLTQAAGTVDASNLTIKDINATGEAIWLAYINQQNIDAGNNDGWDFSLSPIVGGVEYTYSIRSFTQLRRF